MIILHVANYVGDRKNGIDVVVDNIMERSRHTNIVYSTSKRCESGITNTSFFKVLSFFFKNKPDLIVFHSLYSIKTIAVYLLAYLFGTKYSVFPHASFTLASQNKSKFKKKIFRKFFLNSFINGAAYVNFLNYDEQLGSFPVNAPVAIVGNGVALGEKNNKEKYISFLGRYDVHHKGIDVLLDAILILSEKLRSANFKFIFRGVFEKESDAYFIHNFISQNCIGDIIDIGGPIFDYDSKNKFLSKSKFYILTSRYEGVPITVLEAFANYTPVIVTPGTNMVRAVEDYGLGFSPKFCAKEIAEVIYSAINLSDDEYGLMADSCYYYAETHLEWDKIVNEHDDNYEKYSKSK